MLEIKIFPTLRWDEICSHKLLGSTLTALSERRLCADGDEKKYFLSRSGIKSLSTITGGRTMSDGWRKTAEENKKPGPENEEACLISSTSFSWWLMCIKNKLSQSWRIKRNFSHSSPLSFTARFSFAIRLPFFVLAEHSFTVRSELFKYERSFWWREKKFLNKKVS